jgi:hypothetical protein
VLAVVIALLAALYALGKTGNNNGGGTTGGAAHTDTTTTTPVPHRTTSTTSAAAIAQRRARRQQRAAAAAKLVRLQVVPTGPGPVFVCLQAAGGQMRIPGVSLQPGASSGTYRSSKFVVRLGNGNVRLRVNGKLRSVGSGSPLAYTITRKAMTRVSPSSTPTCVR